MRLVDGTLIGCANSPGCASHSHFAGHASYGYCPSKSEFVWGMRLVLVADPKGVPVGYDLGGPNTGEERDSALWLAAAHPGSLLFADGGFWGRELDASLELIELELVTPAKHKLGEPPESEAGARSEIPTPAAVARRGRGACAPTYRATLEMPARGRLTPHARASLWTRIRRSEPSCRGRVALARNTRNGDTWPMSSG